jgi:acylphosphatase
VEGEAQGSEDSLKKFLADIDRGPPSAHVVKLEKSEKDTDDGETSFKVEKTVRK